MNEWRNERLYFLWMYKYFINWSYDIICVWVYIVNYVFCSWVGFFFIVNVLRLKKMINIVLKNLNDVCNL